MTRLRIWERPTTDFEREWSRVDDTKESELIVAQYNRAQLDADSAGSYCSGVMLMVVLRLWWYFAGLVVMMLVSW